MRQKTALGFPNIVELRTGAPYANLINNQQRFSADLGSHFQADPGDVLPMAGTTGAIEAVRNHVFRLSRSNNPAMLTVRPGYWRARESFEGFGFEVIDVLTESFGFSIGESAIVEMARKHFPALVYLSLPNNPTGALFDPFALISALPEKTAVIIDLTLPSRDLDSKAMTTSLYLGFRGRSKLFLAGSTSKSHGTAECRIGWLVCPDSRDAKQIRKENRNVLPSFSIREAIAAIDQPPPALDPIGRSFKLLRDAEKQGRLQLVTPKTMTQTAYVLIRLLVDPEEIRRILEQNRISVMWGPEFGLGENYIRLETLEPANVEMLIEALGRDDQV